MKYSRRFARLGDGIPPDQSIKQNFGFLPTGGLLLPFRNGQVGNVSEIPLLPHPKHHIIAIPIRHQATTDSPNTRKMNPIIHSHELILSDFVEIDFPFGPLTRNHQENVIAVASHQRLNTGWMDACGVQLGDYRSVLVQADLKEDVVLAGLVGPAEQKQALRLFVVGGVHLVGLSGLEV